MTGAARGIGLAITERLAAEGARVALVDRDAEVEAVAKRLGPRARGLVADITHPADVDRAVAAAHRWADRLDIVVNNAGITGRSYPIWKLNDQDWHDVIAVDLTSVFLVCRAAVRLMLPRRSGRIVNIASIAGKEGNPTLVPYSTAKAGVPICGGAVRAAGNVGSAIAAFRRSAGAHCRRGCGQLAPKRAIRLHQRPGPQFAADRAEVARANVAQSITRRHRTDGPEG